jgi:hypothetical protein
MKQRNKELILWKINKIHKYLAKPTKSKMKTQINKLDIKIDSNEVLRIISECSDKIIYQ